MRYALPLLLLAACATAPKPTRVSPPPAQLPEYTIQRTAHGLVVDGTADEADWAAATPIHFIFPWNDTAQEPPQSTVAKMLWDDDKLYISYVCIDPYLDSEVTDKDGPVYQEDAVEIFAAPSDDITTYYGYEMNINATLLDYIAFGGGEEWTSDIQFPWESEGVQIKTTYQGTLNDHTDTDEGWTLEIAIPFDNFRHLKGRMPPVDGDMWRLNLNRTKGDMGQFSMWSDTRTPHASFHHAVYFGRAFFSSQAVGR